MSRANAPVWALAVGQTLTYAGVYYAFPAILPDLLADTGWTAAELAAGPTLGFLVMAALTPFTGRWVDRGWGGEMLTYTPILAALGVALLGWAPSLIWWLVIWALLGLVQATCLYETCFAFLTRRLGDDARLAITRVTLVAGFSGTLTFPLGALLAHNFGAQGALIGFGLLILFGAVPVNAWAVRTLRRMERAVVLQILDNAWKDHLLAMDHLKEGINLRSYGQKDPLVEYKREAFTIYEDMKLAIKRAVLERVSHIKLLTQEEIEEIHRQQEAILEAQMKAHQESEAAKQVEEEKKVIRATLKVGRNDPCPCGSGKKFKACHGA